LSPQTPLLSIEHLGLARRDRRDDPILRDVSFAIRPREIVGLVGESGSGKTLTAQAALGLVPAWAHASGAVQFRGQNLLSLPPPQLRRLRGSELSMVFQEPRAALNPMQPVGRSVTDVLRAHHRVPAAQAKRQVVEMFSRVGLPDPERQARAYPHQLSGGMCQRVVIAMALIGRPSLVIADEPTTALDVTIQSQILELLMTLAHKDDVAILLITHDLGIVSEVCDRTVTLYAGEVVEEGRTDDVLARPRHPYTATLLHAAAHLDDGGTDVLDVQVLAARHSRGCSFAARCRFREDRCGQDRPPLETLGPDREVRCYRHRDIEPGRLAAAATRRQEP
jgi:peptide/nickel transport system ATP-binding protein